MAETKAEAKAGTKAISFNITRGDEQPSINATKTVTDTDRDGIYELALNVKATSQQSSDTNVTKSNVVMVIDVSGSMGNENSWIYYDTYIYDADTYDRDGNGVRYYTNSTNRNTLLHYGDYYRYNTGGWGQWPGWQYAGTGWYSGSAYGGTAYTDTVYAWETRLHATQRAACAVVDALLEQNKNDDGITDIFEISVIKFADKTASNNYNGTSTIIHDSTNAEDIKDAINDLTSGGGTNWEAALQLALTEANYYKNTDSSTKPENPEVTSVIFLTDGFPTYYGDDYYAGNIDGGENNTNIAKCYTEARDDARNIVSNGYSLYNIFAFGSDTTTYNNHTGFAYLRALTNYAYGSGSTDNYNQTTITDQYAFNAKSTDDLIAAFETIIQHLTNNVGYAGVNLSDGVSLGATSTSVAVNGTAKADSMRYTVKDASNKLSYTVKIDSSEAATFTIYNADGTTTTLTDSSPETVTTVIKGTTYTSKVYSVTVGSGEDAKTYKMSPATIDADTGMVKWDLSGLGILANGYTYTVAFDVWPNQLAYDIAADLNNGIYTSVDAALTAYKVTDATERQHIKDALHKNKDGSYSLYTNYQQKVEYYPATQVIDDSGNEDWSYGDKKEENLEQPDPIGLQGSLLPLRKDWESDLTIEEYNELLWKNGEVNGTPTEYGVTLYVWKAEAEDDLMRKVNTGLTYDNKPYITATLGWDEEQSKYIWKKDVAVAPGRMVNLDEAKALGYDPDNDPENVRTFTNNEGTELQYYVIESGHYYYVTEKEIDIHFELNTVLYHPMVVDGTLYNVGFGPNQTVEKMDPMYAVVATNRLKGGLNIHKVVSTTQVTVEDDEIKNVAEPTDDDGVKTNTYEFLYEIQIWKEDAQGKKSAVYTYDDQIDTENNTTVGGSIGYRIFSEPKKDGDEITYDTTVRGAILPESSSYKDLANGNYAIIEGGVTTLALSMPANGEIRLVNLPAETKYSVREISDATGKYNYAATLSQVQKGTGLTGNTVTTANTVSGTIKGNTAAVETYYNWGANFFIYHSSDKTIEKISFADPRVKGKYVAKDEAYTYSFNIVDETKTDANGKPYLYGGYYKKYSGTQLTNDKIIGAAYDANGWFTDTAGTASAYDATKANVWKKAEAFTDVKDVNTGEGGTGTEMTPIVNGVYFLKEVPNGYIRPYIHYTYHQSKAGKPLEKLFLITASDDKCYDSVGFIIKPAETMTGVNTGSTMITFTKPDGTVDAKLTAKTVYTATQMAKYQPAPMGALTRGYLYKYDVTDKIGKGLIFQPCWKTPDKVLVVGLTIREVNKGTSGDLSSENAIGVTDSDAAAPVAPAD